MAVRIRKDGRIFCAALRPAEDGDTYVDDGLHYRLVWIDRVLVTDSNHMEHAEWWWRGNVPEGITMDERYSDESWGK